MVHILSGIKKYEITSLENWVWRIAHNRYSKFIENKNKNKNTFTQSDFSYIKDDYDFVDELFIVDEYEIVFKALHTLSSEYRNIFVDYYIGGLPVKQLANKYELTETTVKWRLNTSREKIKSRIGEKEMDKIYKRVNWDTKTRNGSFDSDKYLYSQVARIICQAAYEKPLAVEEISLMTGIPTLIIEDELPRLIQGDAIVKESGKYAANFIILRLCDKKIMESKFDPFVIEIADYFEELFAKHETDVADINFFGADFTMQRLGYIVLPAVLRGKINQIKNVLDINDGPYPPRLDGGYGWFLVDEKETDDEDILTTISGCNVYRESDRENYIYYFWIGKYLDVNVGCVQMICNKELIKSSENGFITDDTLDTLTDDYVINLIRSNLIIKEDEKYKFNFPVFDKRQYDNFTGFFDKPNAKLDRLLAELINDIYKCFRAFVPKRLNSQINQWVSNYTQNIIGFVAEELINRSVLETPEEEKPLVNGVFCVKGEMIKI
jgi:RNA polymerase sigma factor (sigma-70 family)